MSSVNKNLKKSSLKSSDELNKKFLKELNYPEPPVKNEVDFYKLLFKMVFATVIAVVFILVIFWLFKGKTIFSQNRYMKVLDQFQFAPGKNIYIVELYEKILIVATSGDNVTLLSEVNELEEKKRMKLELSQKKSVKKFDDLLKDNMGN